MGHWRCNVTSSLPQHTHYRTLGLGAGRGCTTGWPSLIVTFLEDQYRDMTGIDEVSEFDGSGVELCIVETGIDVSHPALRDCLLYTSDAADE